MFYGKRYSRRRFRKRSYGRSYRYSRRRYRYPKSTRVRATYALRKAKGVSRSIYRLRKKFDFQRYYNWNQSTYTLFIGGLGNPVFIPKTTGGKNSILYKMNNAMISSTNVMPYWIRGSTSNGNPPQFNPSPLTSGNEGIKPGQDVSVFQNSTIQGGRFRCKSVYCRWNFRWIDRVLEEGNIPAGSGSYNSMKIRLCVFTLYEQQNTNAYVANVAGVGDLTYSPIGSNNNNAYFNENYSSMTTLQGNITDNNFSVSSPLMIMKTTGSTRLKKVYDRTFTLNRLKTTKTVKVNLFKNKIMKFDADYVPNPLQAGYTLVQWPFNQIYFCVMVEPSIYYFTDGDGDNSRARFDNTYLVVDNQNVVIYYDT